jgi:hypothetical protein
VKTHVLFAAIAALSLSACATAPGDGSPPERAAVSRIAITSVTSIAVGRVIERDNADAATKVQRAQRIVAIATALQSLGEDALATLPQATAALAPLLDRAELAPLERMQADLLVEALVAAALERVKVEAGPTYATINLVLGDVIRAASYYLPAASPTG